MRSRLALLVSVLGCGSSGTELRVDLRSDWVGGVEVAEVVARVVGLDGEVSTRFAPGDDLAAGVRIGLFEDVPSGTQRVEVEMRGPAGEVVAERSAVVSVRGSTGVTLLVTRNCEGVTCDDPAANQCLDGRCVPPTCTVENTAECGPPSCTRSVDCVATATCVEPQCIGGACLRSGGACGTGRYCDPESGCRALPSTQDAGSDAATDASLDASMDAGFDGGIDAPSDVGTDVGDTGVACSVHEPDDDASQSLAIGTEGDIDGNDVFTSDPLVLCSGDEDWIAVRTLGLVRATVSLQGVAPSTSQVCLELYNYTDLSDAVGDPPTLELGPTCAPVAPGDFVTLGPLNGTLVGGGNYIIARVTFGDERDEPVYTVRFDGEPSF